VVKGQHEVKTTAMPCVLKYHLKTHVCIDAEVLSGSSEKKVWYFGKGSTTIWKLICSF